MYYVVFFGGKHFLYYALHSIFGGWILFILCTTEYFRGLDTIYTMYYAVFWRVNTIYPMYYTVFSGVGYYLYYVLRSILAGEYCSYYVQHSIFEGLIQFILCTTEHFLMVNTFYTMHYTIFSGVGYYLYYVLRSILAGENYLSYLQQSIFGGWIIFILCTTQYFGGWILFILYTTQYFRGNTIYTMCNTVILFTLCTTQ